LFLERNSIPLLFCGRKRKETKGIVVEKRWCGNVIESRGGQFEEGLICKVIKRAGFFRWGFLMFFVDSF
jgi:hypothetical protein